jgi:hypothetical protein
LSPLALNCAAHFKLCSEATDEFDTSKRSSGRVTEVAVVFAPAAAAAVAAAAEVVVDMTQKAMLTL